MLDCCPDTASVHSKRQAAMRTKQRNGNSLWRQEGQALDNTTQQSQSGLNKALWKHV